MAKYDRKDRFYKMAKAEGKASRAYYKIEQIQKKYKIIKKGDFIVDLGCAPGGWLQWMSDFVGAGGLLLGIDLLPVKIPPKPNIEILQGDIENEMLLQKIREVERPVDAVVCDISPNLSGIKFKDSYLSYELAMTALGIAKKTLREGGNFVTKIFPGDEFNKFKDELKKSFKEVFQFRPEATRKTSTEVYLVGRGCIGDPSLRSG